MSQQGLALYLCWQGGCSLGPQRSWGLRIPVFVESLFQWAQLCLARCPGPCHVVEACQVPACDPCGDLDPSTSLSKL